MIVIQSKLYQYANKETFISLLNTPKTNDIIVKGILDNDQDMFFFGVINYCNESLLSTIMDIGTQIGFDIDKCRNYIFINIKLFWERKRCRDLIIKHLSPPLSLLNDILDYLIDSLDVIGFEETSNIIKNYNIELC